MQTQALCEASNMSLSVCLFVLRVNAPFASGGVHIEVLSSYISIKSTVGLTALWNEDDAFMVNLYSFNFIYKRWILIHHYCAS